jgi:hypothetical protein
MPARIGGFRERRCIKSYPPSDVRPWGYENSDYKRSVDESLEDRRYSSEYLADDLVWNAFQLLRAPRAELERSGLVAADDPSRFSSGSCERHGETRRPREISAAGNRKHYGELRDSVERLVRDDEHRTTAFLLVS